MTVAYSCGEGRAKIAEGEGISLRWYGKELLLLAAVGGYPSEKAYSHFYQTVKDFPKSSRTGLWVVKFFREWDLGERLCVDRRSCEVLHWEPSI